MFQIWYTGSKTGTTFKSDDFPKDYETREEAAEDLAGHEKAAIGIRFIKEISVYKSIKLMNLIDQLQPDELVIVTEYVRRVIKAREPRAHKAREPRAHKAMEELESLPK